MGEGRREQEWGKKMYSSIKIKKIKHTRITRKRRILAHLHIVMSPISAHSSG